MSRTNMEYKDFLLQNITLDSKNLTFLDGNYSVRFQPSTMELPILTSLLILYAVVIVIGIGGNMFVCLTIYHMKKMTITNFFMVNLAISDIMMSTMCLPLTVLSNLVFHYWPFGEAFCPLISFVQVTSVLQRAFTLVAITLDQHRIVYRPLQTRLHKRTARLLIGTLWILAILVSLPVAIFTKIVELPYKSKMLSVCMEDWEKQDDRYLYSITLMILQYFLPLAIVSVCYTHIGIIVWLKKTPGETDNKRLKKENKSKKKTVRMLVSVVIAYALTWLPLHTLTLVGDSFPEIYDIPRIDVIWTFAHLFAFSSTGMNPIIYIRSNATFRRRFIDIFNCDRKSMRVRKSSNNQLLITRKISASVQVSTI